MDRLDLTGRIVLSAGGLLLALIAGRTLADPIGTAAAAGLALRTPGAIGVFLSTGGGFPLGAALFALACAASRRTVGPGLASLAIFIMATLAVRLAAIVRFGGFAAQRGPVIGETLIALATVAVLAARYAADRRRQMRGEAADLRHSLGTPVPPETRAEPVP